MRQSRNALARHALAQAVLEDVTRWCVPGIKQALSAKARASGLGSVAEKERTSFPWLESYFMGVFQALWCMNDEIQSSDDSIAYLSEHPARLLQRLKRKRSDWIVYHYSSLHVTVVSLYDSALILTSRVLRLGIPEASCNNATVRDNDWVKGTRVCVALKLLYKAVQPYVQKRHRFVHRGVAPSSDETLDIRMAELPGIHLSTFFPTGYLDWHRSNRARQLQRRSEAELKVVEDGVVSLFDALCPHYMEKRQQMLLALKSALEESSESSAGRARNGRASPNRNENRAEGKKR